MILLHYTCDHSAARITDTLVPMPHPLLPVPLVWLTDLDPPDVLALGLTSHTLDCDRTSFKVTVEVFTAVPWTRWAHQHRLSWTVRDGLDGAPGARPRHWWVNEGPISILDIERRL